MSVVKDIGPFVVLGAGLVMLGMASKGGKRKLEDRSGEKCDPDKDAPFGYECAQVIGGWELVPERRQFTGFGPYISRRAVDEALASLGFAYGDLEHFQHYMSMAYGWDLQKNGEIDGESMKALKEAESMLARDEWVPPR